MPAVSAILLVAALALAVVIGPQTRPWTWGPAMLCLGGALLAALPPLWRREKGPGDFGLLALGFLTAGWFAWRAWFSPVAELGMADLPLLSSIVAPFVVIRAITGHLAAERILAWGIGLLLAASVVVVVLQIMEPGYSPVFRSKAAENAVTGFFGHYIDGSNFLVTAAALLAGWGLFGQEARPVRALWLLIALAGLAGVWFTHSRGGILAAAAAGAAFAVALLVIGKKRDAKWFVPVFISAPLIGIGIVAYLYQGWSRAQEARVGKADVAMVMDDVSRLYFLGVASSTAGLHPMAGGGARSFSWECYRFVEGADQGDIITRRPEFVHNELMQAVTDYGIMGAGLLVVFLGTLLIGGLLQLIFGDRGESGGNSEAWQLGGVAALTGMLAQSCFSFSFHLLPGAVLLGIVLGLVFRSRPFPPGARVTGSRILITLAAIGCMVVLFPKGWAGLQATRAVWASHFAKGHEPSAETRIDALTLALRHWPHSGFHQERAALFQSMAGAPGDPQFAKYAALSIADYEEAARLHPFDPGFRVNRANLLSQLGQDAAAEEAFALAIHLQGGMEPGFKAHFSFANHYLRKGLRLYDPERPDASNEMLERAAVEIENAIKKMHWSNAELQNTRLTIHENLGASREAADDIEGAMQAYDFASSLSNGRRVHYRAGILIGKNAVVAWSKRKPSEAMKLFIQAKERINQSHGQLPEGVTPSASVEYRAYLDRSIDFLKGAKVTPAP